MVSTQTEVVTRKPKGEVNHSCPGCNKIITVGWRRGKKLTFVTHKENGKWVGQDIYHEDCYEEE